MKGYLDEIEDKAMAKGIARRKAEGLAQGMSEGKIIGAVDILLSYKFDTQTIKSKVIQSYPNLDPKKLDQIIAVQMKKHEIS